jgi:ABC-type Na+ transport system ATPase subunit NatA
VLVITVPRGEVFGFLGINGAGKTTTMSILTGGMRATSGDAWLNGHSIRSQQLMMGGNNGSRSQLGYCPQHNALIDLLSVKEHLYLFARIKGVCEERDLPSHVAAVVAELDLAEVVDRPSGQLSGGNKRKLSVAIATIGRPPLVCLDAVHRDGPAHTPKTLGGTIFSHVPARLRVFSRRSHSVLLVSWPEYRPHRERAAKLGHPDDAQHGRV